MTSYASTAQSISHPTTHAGMNVNSPAVHASKSCTLHRQARCQCRFLPHVQNLTVYILFMCTCVLLSTTLCVVPTFTPMDRDISCSAIACDHRQLVQCWVSYGHHHCRPSCHSAPPLCLQSAQLGSSNYCLAFGHMHNLLLFLAACWSVQLEWTDLLPLQRLGKKHLW